MKEYLLPHIAELEGYVPGEQPQEEGFVKLNTNENPYPCSPDVFDAVTGELERLRLYPDPGWTELRRAAAEICEVPEEWVFCGNGSDEALSLICRSFLGPGRGACYPVPTYTLYRTLAALRNAPVTEIPFAPSWKLPLYELYSSGAVVAFIANPNSPTGTFVDPVEIRDFTRDFKGLVVVDEAYVDFGDEDCLHLVKELDNAVVLRSLSKSYALAGLRVGFMIARPELISTLMNVKDSYNLDRLASAGGAAALRDRDHFEQITSLVKGTRKRLEEELRRRGFEVLPSRANFLCVRPPEHPGARTLYEGLKERKVLVRYFPAEMPDYLRVTVGTDQEVDIFLRELDALMKDAG